MPRAIQRPRPIRHPHQMVELLVHELPTSTEGVESADSDNQMNRTQHRPAGPEPTDSLSKVPRGTTPTARSFLVDKPPPPWAPHDRLAILPPSPRYGNTPGQPQREDQREYYSARYFV